MSCVCVVQVQAEYKASMVPLVQRAARAAGIQLALPLSLTFVAPAEFSPGHVRIDPGETVAVVAWMMLHTLPDDSVLRSNPRDAILKVGHLVHCWCTAGLPMLCHWVTVDVLTVHGA